VTPTQAGHPEHVDVVFTDPDPSVPIEIRDEAAPIVVDYAPVEELPTSNLKQDNLSLKQKAVRSSVLTLAAFATGQLIRFGTAPLLANLLVKPEYLGVINLVAVFTTLMVAMSDVGVEQAIIQNKRGDDPIFLNTAFTLHAVRGLFLWLGACAIAYPVYWFYRDQEQAHYLLWMLPASGFSLLLNGLNSTSTYTLNRHLRIGRLTIVNLSGQIINITVTLICAWIWRSPWAIITGGITQNVFLLIVTHLQIPGYRNRFCWDLATRKELMKFGKWILISTLTTYLAFQIDRPMLAKLTDLKWLGLYGIATGLVLMPREVIGRLAAVTLFPAISRTAEERPDELPKFVNRARGMVLTAALVGTLAVVLGGPIFIGLFYKSEFHTAGWLTQLVSISAWFILLTTTADRALLAQGKTKSLAASNFVSLIATIVCSLAGMLIEKHIFGDPYGTTGFILGLAVGKLVGHGMIQYQMAQAGMPIVRQDLAYTLALLALSLVGIWLPEVFNRAHPGHAMLYQSIVGVSLCSAAAAWAALKVWRARK